MTICKWYDGKYIRDKMEFHVLAFKCNMCTGLQVFNSSKDCDDYFSSLVNELEAYNIHMVYDINFVIDTEWYIPLLKRYFESKVLYTNLETRTISCYGR